MRDHRKVAFYDISEDDPNRGEAILTGADKRFEIWVLDHAPGWLIDLTTSI